MRVPVLLASLAILPVSAAAQQPTAPGTTQAPQPPRSFGTIDPDKLPAPALDSTTVAILQSAACPTGFRASFNSRSQIMKVRKPGDPDPAVHGPAQHVRLVLGNLGGLQVASVRVTAFGLNARGRIERASDAMAKGSDRIRRTTNLLQFFTDKNGVLSADLILPGFSAVHNVKLESITFSDGTTRSYEGTSLCIVPVDPLMLVDASQ